MPKRIIAAAAAALIALTAMPLALAWGNDRLIHSVPAGYNANDYEKVVRFLDQEDSAGVTNGYKISIKYDPEDPSTWGQCFGWGRGRLTSFVCSDLDLVGTVDLANCTELTQLSFEYNRIDSVDVAGCVSLRSIECCSNHLETLDISGLSSLKTIHCGGNEIKKLDLSDCPDLVSLWCWDNSLTALDVTHCSAIEELLCSLNPLKELDVTHNPRLGWLMAEETEIGRIDVTGCPVLYDLDVSRNYITELDVSGCPLLTALDCSKNLLTQLDAGDLNALSELNCSNNMLTSIQLPKSIEKMRSFNCSGNRLAELNVGFAISGSFDCTGNPLKKTDAICCFGADNGGFKLSAAGRGCVGFRSLSTEAATTAVNRFEAYPDEGAAFLGWFDADGGQISADAVFETAESGFTSVTAMFSGALTAPVTTLSTVAETGKTKVSWEKIEGAASYQVYRSEKRNSGYSLMKTTSSTSYINTKSEPGIKYWYKVRAVDEDGNKSRFSSPKYRYTKLARPVVKGTHVASTGKNKLTWETVDGASAYEIWRADSKDGEYVRKLTTVNTSYTNTAATAGETYYYKVIALHEVSSSNSAASEVKSLTCDLARPTVSISLSGGKPKLTWGAVDGAKEYRVYRAENAADEFVLVWTTTNLSYTNTKTTAGNTYYYKVMAVHENPSANSAYSTVKSIKATK